ncbi:MAG: hypothetical protein P1U35_13800, partial [Cycloclasticus sp.]|nr:hypothetical protein [Cycloclasticus sp.]
MNLKGGGGDDSYTNGDDIEAHPDQCLRDSKLILKTASKDDADDTLFGCRPDHEFVAYNSYWQGDDFHYFVKCAFDGCNAKRALITHNAPKANSKKRSKKKLSYDVIEFGNHYNNHPPATRARHRWMSSQTNHMQTAYTQDRNISSSDLLASLQLAQLAKGCTNSHVQWWLKSQRKKDSFQPNDATRIDLLKAYVCELSQAYPTEGQSDTDIDEHRAMILPLPNNREHILLGDDVKEDKPKLTQNGEKISYCIPLTTKCLLRNKVKTRTQKFEVINIESLAHIHRTGVTTSPVPSKGFLEIDGVHKLLWGDGVILHIGTSCNNEWRLIGYCIVSGETADNVEATLRAFDQATEDLFTENGSSEWIMCDSGPGMSKGVDAVVPDSGRCAVHLTEDDIPRQQKKLKNRSLLGRFKTAILRMKMFPPPLFSRYWLALKHKWSKERKEASFTLSFEKNHVQKNSGWMGGKFAVGVRNHTNMVEMNHNHTLKKPLLQALKKKKPKARFPAPFLEVTQALAEVVLPMFSKQEENKPFEQVITPDAKSIRMGKAFARDGNLAPLGRGVYASRQKTEYGPLYLITRNGARTTGRLYAKKHWKPTDLNRLGTTRFTTINSCFPCNHYMNHGWCFHIIGVRELEKVPPLGVTDQSPNDPDWIGSTLAKGRPKTKKNKEFMSQRLFGLTKNSKNKRKPRGVPSDSDSSESSFHEAEIVDILGEERANKLVSYLKKTLTNIKSTAPQKSKSKSKGNYTKRHSRSKQPGSKRKAPQKNDSSKRRTSKRTKINSNTTASSNISDGINLDLDLELDATANDGLDLDLDFDLEGNDASSTDSGSDQLKALQEQREKFRKTVNAKKRQRQKLREATRKAASQRLASDASSDGGDHLSDTSNVEGTNTVQTNDRISVRLPAFSRSFLTSAVSNKFGILWVSTSALAGLVDCSEAEQQIDANIQYYQTHFLETSNKPGVTKTRSRTMVPSVGVLKFVGSDYLYMDSGKLQFVMGKHYNVPFFPVQIRSSGRKGLPKGEQKIAINSLMFFKATDITWDNRLELQSFDVKTQQLAGDSPVFPIHV